MTILLLETIHPDGLRLLEGAGRVVQAADGDEAMEIAGSEEVHAIVTRGKEQVRTTLLDRCQKLRVVGRVGVGLDNIDVDEARKRRIAVVNVPGATTTAVAEHTMMLILALSRGLVPLLIAVKRGHWRFRHEYTGDDVAGKTLGIIGMGAIGSRVAQLATAFGMSVVYWNRTDKVVKDADGVPYRASSFADVLRESDVVSVSVALTDETRGMLGADELAMMKPGALLVNTARGAVIDQAALVDSLATGHLGGFAADVLAEQPPAPEDPLLQFDNVIVTPHAAALTERTFRELSVRCATNVLSVLNNPGPT